VQEVVLDKIFSEEDYETARNVFPCLPLEMGEALEDRVAKALGVDRVSHTYSHISNYQKGSRLEPHKDEAYGCDFVLSVQLDTDEPYPLIVDGTEYVLEQNQGLLHFGYLKTHGRPEFKGEKCTVLVINFSHYIEREEEASEGEGCGGCG
jgi:hypothetical protein